MRQSGGAKAPVETTPPHHYPPAAWTPPAPRQATCPWLGVYYRRPPRQGRGEAGIVVATDRRVREPWRVPPGKEGGAKDGDIVVAEPFGRRRSHHDQAVRVTQRLGRFDSAEALNVIAIHTLDLPHEFSAAALAEAAEAGAPALVGRADLRALPLVTIDGEDARDFDDAVLAEPLGDDFRIIVAIADVAHYVRPGSALDRAAQARGNSVYLPGLVLPMLPPSLSDHWCSLVPGEDRGVLFAEIVIDKAGRKRRHRFARGLMRSRARLTYEAVQHAWDTGSDAGLPPQTLANLRAAWQALDKARKVRGALALELPENRVVLDATGRISAVRVEPRLDSHRLIEEFMIAANVAAAEELAEHRLPGLFRVHAPPSAEKLATLATCLHEVGVPLPGGPLDARALAPLLASLAGGGRAAMASASILRALPQAGYSPKNAGHFGLALTAYAHFTSPIRRYADLLVHRALLGRIEPADPADAGRPAPSGEETAQHLSLTERRATEAERSVLMRAHAILLAQAVGNIFDAAISGVTRSALFVTLVRNGAEGIVPVSSLERDLWRFDREAIRLSGARSGVGFSPGNPVRVQLIRADPVSGRLVFRLSRPERAGRGPLHMEARSRSR